MTRGKYAAKAANRLATLDNEIITDLRQKLASNDADKKRLANELADLRRDFNSQVIKTVDKKVNAERLALREAIATERADMLQSMNEAADLVANVTGHIFRSLIEEYGDKGVVFPTQPLWDDPGPTLTKVFRLLAPKRAGQLLETATCGDLMYKSGLARRRRRRTAAKLESDIRFNAHKPLLQKDQLVRDMSACLEEEPDEQEAE